MIKKIYTSIKKGVSKTIKPSTRTAKKATKKAPIVIKHSESDHEHGFLGDPSRLMF